LSAHSPHPAPHPDAPPPTDLELRAALVRIAQRAECAQRHLAAGRSPRLLGPTAEDLRRDAVLIHRRLRALIDREEPEA
jgi:hypothetical protein